MNFPHLFSQGLFGTLEVKNHLVMPPMVRNYADSNGMVTDRYVAHIERIARGGVGAMILEASFVSPEGRGFVNELGIHTDDCISGLRRLAEVAHQHGAVVGTQLYHAGRQTSIKTTSEQPIAPSAVADPTTNETPREMTKEDIHRIVAAFGAAAARAKKAGLDFVEIHGAHGYLITQFLSPFSNKRNDDYGGSLEHRMRFMDEVYASVRGAVGADFPILVRLSADEMVDGGITLDDTLAIAHHLEKKGVNALHISVGNYASYAKGYMISPMAMPDAPLVDFARRVKSVVDIPVIAVGKIRDPKMAEEILERGDADFIAIGRTLLADPEWPNKVQAGKLDEIMPCIACNQGCISRLFAQQDVWCTVNPETGREEAFSKPTEQHRTVVVVGGGPAGMSAAKTAAQRGHRVILFEKEPRLGGQLVPASIAPHREGWEELRQALVRDLERLEVEVRLSHTFVLADLAQLEPHTVIVAVGSSATVPNIPGIERTQVVTSRDLLEGRVALEGDRVVIVGGGCAGAQTAEALAEKGHRVMLVEAKDEIAIDAPVDDRALLLGRLEKLDVSLRTNTSLKSIGEKSVTIAHDAGDRTYPADMVVLCLGSFPNDGFLGELKTMVRNVKVVGDAVSPRRVTEAIEEGALAALAI